MGAISGAKGVTQISNDSAMAGPEQIMELGDELARLVGESIPTLAGLPAADSLSLNGVKNWVGRTVFVEAERAHLVWTGEVWVRQRRTAGGSIAKDTDGNGFITVEHTLGVIPDWASVTPRQHESVDANSRLFRPVLWGEPTAATFRVRYIREDDNAWLTAPQNIRFYWSVGKN